MSEKMNRRAFVATTAAVGTGLAWAGAANTAAAGDKPALLGGKRIRNKSFSSWPLLDGTEDKALLDVLHSGRWYRGYGASVNTRFEAAYAKLLGAKHCLSTCSGTNALFASLNALEIGPGDEVILSPYTFVATLNVVLLNYALPIFVDSDLETFQVDAQKIEPAVTDRTALLLPVHLGGAAADLDTILAVARKHKLPVVEDACQSHLAEWRGRKVGVYGATGCFSFQNSKNLTSGDGGAVLTNDDVLAQKCRAFHTNAMSTSTPRATNVRMTEFQAALLLAQMTRLESQSQRRWENGQYLTTLLREIPGIAPARMYDGCTRNAYHLFMLRYDAQAFAGLPREKFLAALGAEGIPASSGYTPLNKDAYVKNALQSRGYRKIYSKAELDAWEERTQCPINERLCAEAVWFTQNVLLGNKDDMEQIAAAIRRIQKHAAELVKA